MQHVIICFIRGSQVIVVVVVELLDFIISDGYLHCNKTVHSNKVSGCALFSWGFLVGHALGGCSCYYFSEGVVRLFLGEPFFLGTEGSEKCIFTGVYWGTIRAE